MANEGPRGTGTRASGYLPPEDGPFRCGNCNHFHAAGDAEDDASRGLCDEPHAIHDPLVRGRVQAGGCCSFFMQRENQDQELDDEFDDRGTEALAR